MRLSELGSKLLTKCKAALDRPLSILELELLHLEFTPGLSYRQRCILRDFAWILKDGCFTVYDIGANEGQYTSAFAKLKQISHIVAIEPLPDVYYRLSKAFDDDPKVKTINCALGEERGKLVLNANEFSAASSLLDMADIHRELFPETSKTTTVEVSVETLDELVRQNNLPTPDLIKIDVQGYEDRVIKGAANTVDSAKYCVVEVTLIELYAGSPTLRALDRIMEDRCFRVVGFIDQLQPTRAQRPVAVDLVYRNEGFNPSSNRRASNPA